MSFFNNMYINPAFTANSDTFNHKEIKLFATNKFADARTSHAYPVFNYYTATFEMPLKKLRSGAGILAEYDDYLYFHHVPYETKLSALKLFYQYNPVNNIFIGLSAGIIDYELNVGKGFQVDKSLQPVFDAGLLYKSKRFFGGISIKNLNRPTVLTSSYFIHRISIPAYERRLNIVAGYKFYFNNTSLDFAALLGNELSVSSTLTTKNKLFFGLLLRGVYSQSVMVGATVFNKFKFFLGYDFDFQRAPKYGFSKNMQSMAGYTLY